MPLSAESLNVIHIVCLLGEKEQHQKLGQPVVVTIGSLLVTRLFKGDLIMWRG